VNSPTPRRLFGAAAVALVLSMLSGCGYALAGRGSFLPEYIRTIGVPLLVNNTTVFDVEQALTLRVREQFISRGRYKVVPDATDADAVLTGELTSVSANPSGFDDQGRATRYVVLVVVKMEFRDLRQNRLLWENAALTFREEYDLATVVSGGTVADTSVFFGSGSNALERLSADFAKTVVSSILEAF
jgi:outer membrane lipopolysaccharide assembly protein LptE/RlpB